MTARIIAKLDVKPPFVVKPVHFEGLRKVGSPPEMAKKYYDQGADEIFYIDIVSSLYRRGIIFDEVIKTAKPLFVPFAVGGGIRNIEDCAKLFHMGADKVVVNTFALQEDPSIINQVAEIFGSQAITVNIEAKKTPNGWICYSDCGRIPSDKSVINWAHEAQERGAGEILLQSVDNDGRRRGFDIELSKIIVNALDIPVVVSSGAGSLEDIKKLLVEARPSGVAIASLLHYDKFSIEDIKQFIYSNEI